ncbi:MULTISPECIES: hypothetical protein [unclassified Kitasatospora]|uniref:hypothetical protein n=1 Tax=unclassified Kitasatospora TaxID=2633591 RepID=UPI000709E452|nr:MULTISPECIES: hypothetical protein [unclassified Kitasatospora]KQV20919.1 hypothetical protein ASC99_20665 [Kitasatospora sp. Root107]KRB60427.1 hypothetical protein ASE03_12515 [Kitasatospora sp. Root187]
MTKNPASGPAPARLVDGRPAFAGRLLVLDRLGLDTYGLPDRHPEPGELRTLARLVERQAHRVDNFDDELRRNADHVITRLTRTRNGDHRDIQSWGVLRTLGSDIETLAARYDLAVEQLGMAIHLYRQANEPADTVRRDAALARTSAAPSPDAVSTAATAAAGPPAPASTNNARR